jgi:hypothetical protein
VGDLTVFVTYKPVRVVRLPNRRPPSGSTVRAKVRAERGRANKYQHDLLELGNRRASGSVKKYSIKLNLTRIGCAPRSTCLSRGFAHMSENGERRRQRPCVRV